MLVDPIKWLPDMGHLTVQAGARYMQFECVPQAEARARRSFSWPKQLANGTPAELRNSAPHNKGMKALT